MACLKGVIRMDSLPMARTYFTEEGYLVDRPILTSTGIFEYRNEDGSIRKELRLPEEVFNKESLESYRLKPIIITHDAGLVTKDNVQEYQVGTIVSDGYRSGDDVRAEIVIHDTNAMKKAGLKELSLGYNLDLDETPGVWEGKPYDAIQRNIRINHLALVREARAGDQARLNIDSRDRQTIKGGKATVRSKIRETTHNDSVLSPEELSKAIEEYKARRSGKDTAAQAVPAVTVAPAPAPVQTPVTKERNGDADEDMKILFDIIDTLLADRAFDAALEEQKTALDAEDKTAEEDPDAAPEETDGEEESNLPPEFLANIGKKGSKGKKAKTDGSGNKDCGTQLDADDEEEPADEEEIATDADGEEAEEEDVLTDTEDDEEPVDEEETPLTEDDASSITYANDKPAPAADRKPAIINADAIDEIVRQRLSVVRAGEKLNLDGLDSMPLRDAKKAIIKAVTPNLRLDGKSNVYIDALYDRAVAETEARTRKDTSYQVKQMYNRDSRAVRADADDSSAESRRRAMIARRQNKEESR